MSKKREMEHKRRKVDPVAAAKVLDVDYKDITFLRKFLSENGKILPARITGCSRKNQRAVTKAIKRARAIGYLPYAGGTGATLQSR